MNDKKLARLIPIEQEKEQTFPESWAKDWNDPKMDVYDDKPSVSLAGEELIFRGLATDPSMMAPEERSYYEEYKKTLNEQPLPGEESQHDLMDEVILMYRQMKKRKATVFSIVETLIDKFEIKRIKP